MRRSVVNVMMGVFVAAVLGLSGCGGGSAGNAGTQGEPNNVPVSKELGSISISLAQSPTNSTAKTVALSTLPTPTHIRIVIRNSATGFKAVKDVAVPMTTAVSIPVPVATGYTVDGLSYIKESYYKRLLKHSQVSGIDVGKDVDTPANLTLLPIPVTITPPSTVVAGAPFTIAITRSPVLKSFSYLQMSNTPITTVLPQSSNYSSGNFTVNSQTATVAGNIYFQVQFFIDDAFVDTTEGSAGSFPTWTFHYPNPTYGDDPISMPFTVPTGGISLGVVY